MVMPPSLDRLRTLREVARHGGFSSAGEALGLTQPAVSKHLRTLREAGLVLVRRDAQRRWYQLRAEPLAELDAWIEPYRQFWAGRLDALERHLDEEEE